MNNINLNPFLRKLDFYLLKRFSKNFFMFFLILISIIFLIEFVELLRRTSENANIQSVHQVLYLSALKLSGSVIHVLPFVIFITTMYTSWRFNRNREMVIIQNIGINSFKILYPFVFFSLLLGVFYIFILNPFLSYGVNSYEKIEQQLFRGKLMNRPCYNCNKEIHYYAGFCNHCDTIQSRNEPKYTETKIGKVKGAWFGSPIKIEKIAHRISISSQGRNKL